MKTFGKRGLSAEAAAPGPLPPAASATGPALKKPAPPPRCDRNRAGAGLKSLARQDLARRSATMHDLEYALEGLAQSRSALPVLQRSAADLVSMCGPALSSGEGASSSFLSACGALPVLARGLRAVPSSDPLVALSVATLLHAHASSDTSHLDAESTRHIVSGCLHCARLQAPASARLAAGSLRRAGHAANAAPAVPAGGGDWGIGTGRSASGGCMEGCAGDGDGGNGGDGALFLSPPQLRELWAHLDRLCPLVAESGLSAAPHAELRRAAPPVARRLCLEALVRLTRRSSRARLHAVCERV
jgi:hypothetical protein